jgi:hypothetical protein
MPDAPKCSSCGAEFEAGAPSCAACGKIVAAPVSNATPVITGCLGGFALGLVLTIVAAVLGSSNYISHPGTRGLGVAIVLTVAIVLPAALFLAGLALAMRGKPALGTFLMTGAAIGFALPSPCTIAVLYEVFQPPVTMRQYVKPVRSWTPQPFTPVTAPPTSSVATFGPARTPRPVYIPAPH